MAHGSWLVFEVALMYALMNLLGGLFCSSNFESSQKFEAQNVEAYEIDRGREGIIVYVHTSHSSNILRMWH